MDTVLETTAISDRMTTHPLLSWRSVIAGFVVAMFSYLILLSLGIAVGSVSMIDGADSSARSIGLIAGTWILVSAAASLLWGSYFAARISKFAAPMIGSAQAVVISALFFGFMTFQMISYSGMAGKAIGSTFGLAGQDVAAAVQSTVVSDAVENSLQGLNLKSDTMVVAQGITLRFIEGNPTAARDYLSRQSGLAPTEIQARMDMLQAQVQTAMADARSAVARATAAAAWSLFTFMVIGMISSIVGGFLGSRTNVTQPLSRTEYRPTMRPATI